LSLPQTLLKHLDKNWPSKDKNKALIKVQEWGDKIPIGIFFRRNI